MKLEIELSPEAPSYKAFRLLLIPESDGDRYFIGYMYRYRNALKIIKPYGTNETIELSIRKKDIIQMRHKGKA